MDVKNLLKNKIISDAIIVKPSLINVSKFINHQIDMNLMYDISTFFVEHFKDKKPNKILTVEASGIIPAGLVAYFMGLPLVYAKKKSPITLGGDVYSRKIFSTTRGEDVPLAISKAYLNENDNILIIDDFLSSGGSVLGLVDILNEARTNIVGFGVIIEKGFEQGRSRIEEMGIDVFSLIRIKSIENGIEFDT